MKAIACFVLLLASGLLAQTSASSSESTNEDSTKRSDVCGCEITIFAGVAEKLLVRKVNPVLTQPELEARGTVVVMIKIDTNGDVLHPKVISGPALLQKPVLDAVRKCKYKPYLINGEAVEVGSTVSATLPNP
jgi:hypothetical protein